MEALNSYFDGIDIIIDEKGNKYIAEVNIPCGFVTFQKNGIDVTGKILDSLINKIQVVEKRKLIC